MLELCTEHLKDNVNVDNVISTFCLAEKFQLSRLQLHCVSFLQQKLPEVGQKQELREHTPAQINHFLECEHVATLSPEIKLFLIISWLTEDVSDRQKFLVLLLKHINWPVVAKDFLEEISQTENFFTSNPSSLYLLLQTLHSSSICLGPYEHQFSALRDEYSYLLSSVVSSSVVLGSGKQQAFTPVSFTFVTPATGHIATEGHSGAAVIETSAEEMGQSPGNSKTQPLSAELVGDVTTLDPTVTHKRKMTEDNTSQRKSLCVDKNEINSTQSRTLTHSIKLRPSRGSILRKNEKLHKAPVQQFGNKKDNLRKKLGEVAVPVTSENISDGYGEGQERYVNNVEESVCHSPPVGEYTYTPVCK